MTDFNLFVHYFSLMRRCVTKRGGEHYKVYWQFLYFRLTCWQKIIEQHQYSASRLKMFYNLFVIWSWVRKMTHWVNTNQSCYLINTSSCFYWHIKSLLKQQIIYQCYVKTLYYIQTTKIVTKYNTFATELFVKPYQLYICCLRKLLIWDNTVY